MYYSVRMRAAEGGAHEMGGRHISGAERLVRAPELEAAAAAMIRRALGHPRGAADFISVRIDAVPEASVAIVPALAVSCRDAATVAAARAAAVAELVAAGVPQAVAAAGLNSLAAQPEAMRGARLVSAVDGARLDARARRGVRVSRMDGSGEAALRAYLAEWGMDNDHAPEALVLASKVAACPGVVAELCWSDDPGYTTGYVASAARGYCRIPCLKEAGSDQGGRVFFLAASADVAAVCRYLESRPVKVVKEGRAE